MNSECKMQNKPQAILGFILHSSFYVLHFHFITTAAP